MKSLLNIIEGLKIGSKTKIHHIDKENWSIDKAENGDMIVINSGLLFIYKSLDTEKKFSTFSNAIVYHACCSIKNESIPENHNLQIGPSIGVGTTKDNKINNYKLAPKKLCDEFIKLLEKEGYKWDEVKLELTKI